MNFCLVFEELCALKLVIDKFIIMLEGLNIKTTLHVHYSFHAMIFLLHQMSNGLAIPERKRKRFRKRNRSKWVLYPIPATFGVAGKLEIL